jgi:formylglycine-generating enzyme required for sulfatase activity
LPSEKEWEQSSGYLGKNIRNPYRVEYEFSNCNTIEYQSIKNFYQIVYDKNWVMLHDFNPNKICDTVRQLQIKYFWINVEPTESVYFGKKNNYGLYNMIGNVAEMVAQKGISKGGDYYHNLFEAKPKKNIPYSKQEAWLGFRCACRYLIKPKNS